jgi:hypothetical protein
VDAGSATLDQVLSMLASVAMSQSMQAELAAYRATLSVPVAFTLDDANGGTETVMLDDTPAAAWLPTALAHAETALSVKLLAPLPAMMVSPDPGGFLMADGGGEFRHVGYRGYLYHVNCAVFATSDFSDIAQRQARMLIHCFDSLVWRTHEGRGFGSLVASIEADGPVEESGVRPYRGGGLIAGARVRYSVRTIV